MGVHICNLVYQISNGKIDKYFSSRINNTFSMYPLTGLEPARFRCLVPECNEDAETATVTDFGLDIFWHNDDDNIDFCRRYPSIDDANIVDGQCSSSSFNTSQWIEKDSLSFCDPSVDGNVVIYDNFGMDSTAVTRFHLICKDQYKVRAKYQSTL